MYRVMIVDDEPLTREYMRHNIPRLDNRWEVVAEAMDGSEALDILKTLEVDLIITDIKMPIMDGIRLTREVRSKYPDQYIVILSGFEEFEFAKKAIEYGVRDYILKPIVKEKLASLLKDISKKLDEEYREQQYYKGLMAISEESRNLLIRNFLRSVITNSHIEIKSQYPLIHRLKVNLIDSEAIIMLLDINEEEVYLSGSTNRDVAMLRFFLNETATEYFKDNDKGFIFSDDIDNTIVLIKITDRDKPYKMCERYIKDIHQIFKMKTGIGIHGALGSVESEVLNLGVSYLNALSGKRARLIDRDFDKLIYAYGAEQIELYRKLEHIINDIRTSIQNNNQMNQSKAIAELIGIIPHGDKATIIQYGLHLIEKLYNRDKEILESKSLALKELEKIIHNRGSSKELQAIFYGITSCFDINTKAPEDENQVVNLAKDFIYANYREPISLAMIADEIGVTPSYLSSVFHRETGNPYTKYITMIRMEEAAKLISKNRGMKIYDVADQVGYTSVKHFSHIFRKYHNQTPSQFRRLIRG